MSLGTSTWYWPGGVIDPRTGEITRIPVDYTTAFHGLDAGRQGHRAGVGLPPDDVEVPDGGKVAVAVSPGTRLGPYEIAGPLGAGQMMSVDVRTGAKLETAPRPLFKFSPGTLFNYFGVTRDGTRFLINDLAQRMKVSSWKLRWWSTGWRATISAAARRLSSDAYGADKPPFLPLGRRPRAGPFSGSHSWPVGRNP
jgi:hypothetical protein